MLSRFSVVQDGFQFSILHIEYEPCTGRPHSFTHEVAFTSALYAKIGFQQYLERQ